MTRATKLVDAIARVRVHLDEARTEINRRTLTTRLNDLTSAWAHLVRRERLDWPRALDAAPGTHTFHAPHSTARAPGPASSARSTSTLRRPTWTR